MKKITLTINQLQNLVEKILNEIDDKNVIKENLEQCKITNTIKGREYELFVKIDNDKINFNFKDSLKLNDATNIYSYLYLVSVKNLDNLKKYENCITKLIQKKKPRKIYWENFLYIITGGVKFWKYRYEYTLFDVIGNLDPKYKKVIGNIDGEDIFEYFINNDCFVELKKKFLDIKTYKDWERLVKYINSYPFQTKFLDECFVEAIINYANL